MPRELFWLMWTVALSGVMWIPYILDRSAVRGLPGAMANPSPNDRPQSPWAQRMMAAHDNAVENLVLFAPLVLVAHALNTSSNVTIGACAVYFWARLAHFVIYALGIPVLRTLAWTISWLALLVLFLAIFRVL